MENNWKECTIGELCTKITSGGTPKSTNNLYYDNGNIPWLNTKEVNYNRIYKTEKHITKLGLDNSSAKWIPKKSVIVAMYGATAGKIAVNEIDLTTNQACCNLIINETLSNYKFVYYYLSLNTKKLLDLANGAAQQNLNSLTIKKYTINLPPLPEQKAIAQILSSLDDKIELNRQMNQTLEQMAQAMFKSWFVDFDPVFDNAIANNKAIPEELKAKDEKRRMLSLSKYGNNKKPLPKEIQELFPDEFELTEEMGFVPKGWKVDKFDTIAEVKYGKDHKKLEDGNIPVYGSGGIMRYVNQFLYSGESVLIPRKGTLSNIIYVNKEFWSVDTMFFTKIKKDNFARYIYYTLRLLDFNNMNVGSAVPSMTTKVLNNLDTLFPSYKIVQVFDNYLKEYYDKIEQNTKQLEKLTQLRDTLLPKLISGELRVPDELIEKE